MRMRHGGSEQRDSIWNDILTKCGNTEQSEASQIVWHRYAHCARTHTCTKTFYLYGMHFTRGAQAHTHSCPPTSQPSTHSHAHALRHPYFIFMSLKSFLRLYVALIRSHLPSVQFSAAKKNQRKLCTRLNKWFMNVCEFVYILRNIHTVSEANLYDLICSFTASLTKERFIFYQRRWKNCSKVNTVLFHIYHIHHSEGNCNQYYLVGKIWEKSVPHLTVCVTIFWFQPMTKKKRSRWMLWWNSSIIKSSGHIDSNLIHSNTMLARYKTAITY